MSYTSAGSTGTRCTNQRTEAHNSLSIYVLRGNISTLEFAMLLEVMQTMKPTPSLPKERFFNSRDTTQMKCIGRGKKKTIKKHSGELPKRNGKACWGSKP